MEEVQPEVEHERRQLSEQELGHRFWTIVQLFYRSFLVFREQYESYEAKVLEFARQRNTPREDLRLNSEDLATLLDFQVLERLRDGYLRELKDLCHSVFRGEDRTDLLDRYVSDIFHQISILKEEHYNVKTYAPFFERDLRDEELRGILDEAHAGFPKLTKHILFLFEQARIRLEEHLPAFGEFPIFIRSLYLHRSDFVARAYPGGLLDFYRILYPLGPPEGFYRVGLSFYHSGFLAEARTAFGEALAAAREEVTNGRLAPGTQKRKMLDSMLRALEAKLRRLSGPAERPAARRARADAAWVPARTAVDPNAARTGRER